MAISTLPRYELSMWMKARRMPAGSTIAVTRGRGLVVSGRGEEKTREEKRG